jgi:hypothetical protein
VLRLSKSRTNAGNAPKIPAADARSIPFGTELDPPVPVATTWSSLPGEPSKRNGSYNSWDDYMKAAALLPRANFTSTLRFAQRVGHSKAYARERCEIILQQMHDILQGSPRLPEADYHAYTAVITAGDPRRTKFWSTCRNVVSSHVDTLPRQGRKPAPRYCMCQRSPNLHWRSERSSS